MADARIYANVFHNNEKKKSLLQALNRMECQGPCFDVSPFVCDVCVCACSELYLQLVKKIDFVGPAYLIEEEKKNTGQ